MLSGHLSACRPLSDAQRALPPSSTILATITATTVTATPNVTATATNNNKSQAIGMLAQLLGGMDSDVLDEMDTETADPTIRSGRARDAPARARSGRQGHARRNVFKNRWLFGVDAGHDRPASRRRQRRWPRLECVRADRPAGV